MQYKECMSRKTLDATGLLCPLPVLRAARALRRMAPGEVLEVLATDPASRADMPAFCAEAGHILEDINQDGDVIAYLIRKG